MPDSVEHHAERRDDLASTDGQQGRVRHICERVTVAHSRVGQDPVRAGRRPPRLRSGGTEEDDRRRAERAREVPGTGVRRDDQLRRTDESTEFREALLTRHDADLAASRGPEGADPHRAAAPLRRIPNGERPRPLVPVARDDDVHPSAHERGGDLGEPVDRPVSAHLGGADVDDRDGTRRAHRTGPRGSGKHLRRRHPQVEGIGDPALSAQNPCPADAFVHALPPAGPCPARRSVPDAACGRERVEPAATLLTVPVEVDRDVYRSQSRHPLSRPGGHVRHRQKLVDPTHLLDQRPQDVRAREDESMIGERRPQAAQRGDRDEQIAQAERSQDEERGCLPRTGSGHRGHQGALPSAVLFDRDDTLVVDVPYNSDPATVRPTGSARAAVRMVRDAGIPTGVITNQSGLARRLLTPAQLAAVNARVDALLGPFDVWEHCPHLPDEGCECRKPRPGMILRATRRLGVDPARAVMIGDIGADVDAARAAGCRGILVPTARTLPAEVEVAPETAPDLLAAVRRVVSGASR